MSETLVLVLAVLLVLVGLLGVMVPLIPGIPMILAVIVFYGWYEGFQLITVPYIAMMGGITLLSILVDYLSTTLGAKYSGSSRAGVWGAFIGTFVGIFLFPPLGLLIGPWVGAMLGEYLTVNDVNKAVKAGFGTVVGLFSGLFFNLLLGIIMVVTFLMRVL
ncbi:MAG: DUF456 domain-containing protein [Syntrophomonadaceae bacterium]|jgi:uncharacterized protein YqgC (DUF456 family)